MNCPHSVKETVFDSTIEWVIVENLLRALT